MCKEPKQLKKLANAILLELGIDVITQNLSKDGIKIEKLSVLVEKIYDIGYRDGEEKRSTIKEERLRLHNLGFSLQKQKQKGDLLANMEKF